MKMRNNILINFKGTNKNRIIFKKLVKTIDEYEENGEEDPCLKNTLQYVVLSKDSFIGPIFSLQLLLVAAHGQKAGLS